MTVIGQRIREERKRLGYNQADFAALGGVGTRAQVHYESGERVPNLSYLEKIGAAGADTQYIISGERSYDPELRRLKGAERAKAVMHRVVEVEESLGQEFTQEQIQRLMGYAYEHCPTRKGLEEFVRAAYAFGGHPLPDTQEAQDDLTEGKGE